MMFEGPTFLTRPLVNEDVLPPSSHTEILDWERGTAIVEGAGSWAEGLCYCRHVARRLGNGCDYPPDSCLSLGVGAEYLIRNGMARRIDKVRALEILADSRARGMVQMCDNVKQRPTFICNCCPCCCEILEGIRMLKNREAIITSGWLAVSDEDGCNGCNKCVKACPVEAIRLVPASPTGRAPKRKTLAVVNADTCLGCGVCVPHCKFDALSLKKNAARFHTPESMMEKMMLQALERGKLQNLLFDDPKRLSHRVLNALVRMILTLPPTKAVLARDQVKSTFVRLALDGFKKSPQGWMAKAT
jgi:Na+-translocating ferredoxin:NAD+ oxidoreductase RNF subunit RnfB